MKTPPLLPIPLLIVTAIVIVTACILTAGCASMDYQWQQTNAPSVKPWLYITVADPHRTCLDVGASGAGLERILACATWKPVNCIIYAAPDAPRWVIEHEEKHCAGFTH